MPLAHLARKPYYLHMQNKVNQAHDRFAVEMLSDVEVTRELIAKHVPNEITQYLDLDSIEVRSESYTDDLEKAFTDIVVQLRLKDKPEHEAEIYILIEHKSQPEKFARLQILKYKLRKWLEALKAEQRPEYLPIIISMVFTHGEKRWHYSPNFSDLFDCPSDYFKQFIPQFRHLIHDLNVIDRKQIQEQTLLNVVQLAMKYIHSVELREHVGDIYDMLAKIEDPEKRNSLTILVTRYLVGGGGHLDVDFLKPYITRAAKKEDVMQTIEDRIRADQDAISMRKGEKKGQIETLRSTILDQTLIKFDNIPFGFTSRINAIDDTDILKSISGSLIKANSIDEFMAKIDKLDQYAVQ
jgi:predicted transposase YdaD